MINKTKRQKIVDLVISQTACAADVIELEEECMRAVPASLGGNFWQRSLAA